jgi:type I restriction enzyme, S subunit
MNDAGTPEGWREITLDSIIESAVDGPFGSNLKSEHYVDQPGTRVVRLQNIGISRFLDKDRAYVSSAHAAQLSRHSVEPGDLLVASLGDDAHPVARTCQYPAGLEPAIVKADCFRLRLNKKKARHEFVRWLLNSYSARASLLRRAHGVTRDRVNLTSLKGLTLRLPSPPEQEKIAEILDAADESIRSTERLIVKYDHARNGLLDDLIGRASASPMSKVELLDNVARRGSGHTPSKENPTYWNGGIKWVITGRFRSAR